MTIVTKIVDVFNICVQAANLGLWIYIVLEATKAAQVWPVKLLKQRAFDSVDILQLKCVRSIKIVSDKPQFIDINIRLVILLKTSDDNFFPIYFSIISKKI